MGTVLNVSALGDLHTTRKSQDALAPLFAHATETADVLLLAGDLTDYGTLEEAQVLAGELTRGVKKNVPVLAVLGNHDFESGHQDVVARVLTEAGVQVLDGDAVEVGGVGFVGVKGFAGGFGRRTLEPWGESAIKEFVREATNEAMKLESGLARLRTLRRVALLHYAPIAGTVDGEPLEIFPFLGSSRLEEPLNRYGLTAVFHGHAHRGMPEGKTREGVPVYNVAVPLLRRMFPDRPAFRSLQIPLDEAGAQ